MGKSCSRRATLNLAFTNYTNREEYYVRYLLLQYNLIAKYDWWKKRKIVIIQPVKVKALKSLQTFHDKRVLNFTTNAQLFYSLYLPANLDARYRLITFHFVWPHPKVAQLCIPLLDENNLCADLRHSPTISTSAAAFIRIRNPRHERGAMRK